MTSTTDGFAAASQALLQLAERERDFHDLTWRQHMEDAATYLERLAAPTRAPAPEFVDKMISVSVLVVPGDSSSPELILWFSTTDGGEAVSYRAHHHEYDGDYLGPIVLIDGSGEQVIPPECSARDEAVHDWLVRLVPIMRVWLARRGTDHISAEDVADWWQETTGRDVPEVSFSTDQTHTTSRAPEDRATSDASPF